MKKVKLDYRHTDDHRWKQRSRPIAMFLKTMFKLEIITILVIIVLANQIHGIYSQGKHYNSKVIWIDQLVVKEVLAISQSKRTLPRKKKFFFVHLLIVVANNNQKLSIHATSFTAKGRNVVRLQIFRKH